MLLHIPQLLSAPEVAQVRQALEAADWADGRATAGRQAARVKRNLQLPLDSTLAKQLGTLILDRLGECPQFMAAALPLKVLPPRFNRYEGGELVIEDSFGTQSVKLPAGDLIVYPGTSVHRVNPVTRGVRYASFFWTQSLVAGEEQRRTLWQLDQAIQQLSADHPEHASVDPLTGVYHNLLRQWSTT